MEAPMACMFYADDVLLVSCSEDAALCMLAEFWHFVESLVLDSLSAQYL